MRLERLKRLRPWGAGVLLGYERSTLLTQNPVSRYYRRHFNPHGSILRFGPRAGALSRLFCFPCLRLLCAECCEIAGAAQSGASLSGVKRQIGWTPSKQETAQLGAVIRHPQPS